MSGNIVSKNKKNPQELRMLGYTILAECTELFSFFEGDVEKTLGRPSLMIMY
jgi:hypothetical protein